jgi:hypothetical protein
VAPGNIILVEIPDCFWLGFGQIQTFRTGSGLVSQLQNGFAKMYGLIPFSALTFGPGTRLEIQIAVPRLNCCTASGLVTTLPSHIAAAMVTVIIIIVTLATMIIVIVVVIEIFNVMTKEHRHGLANCSCRLYESLFRTSG